MTLEIFQVDSFDSLIFARSIAYSPKQHFERV